MPWDGCTFISRAAAAGPSAAGCGGMIAFSICRNIAGLGLLSQPTGGRDSCMAGDWRVLPRTSEQPVEVWVSL